MSALLRWFTCACLVFSAAGAQADGKAFTLPQKAKVEMADQRALIVFDGKQETLVIDTQIKPVEAGAAAGKQSYAWVVPLPNVPTKVEAGTVGMFDTLRELTRPEMVNRTDAAVYGVMAVMAGVFLGFLIFSPVKTVLAVGLGFCAAFVVVGLAMSFRSVELLWVLTLGVFLGFVFLAWKFPKRRIEMCSAGVLFAVVFVGVLTPVLGSASRNASIGGGAITLYQNETIGSYDTAVLASKDGAALTQWLEKNGYPLPDDTAPMVATLAKEGWCFVAMKLHESSGGLAHPHPMGFVFPATKAIYPMRLTGVGQVAPLTVDLFVCGSQQATATGFRAGCAVGTAQEDPDSNVYDSYWARGASPVPMVHPKLRHFAPDAQVLTWLRGTVPANAMGHDITLAWQPLTPHRDLFYSSEVALKFGLAAALAVLGAAAVAVAIMARLKGKRAAWLAVATGVGLALLGGVGVYGETPKVAAEKSAVGSANARRAPMYVGEMAGYFLPRGLDRAKFRLQAHAPADATWLRAAIEKFMDEDWNKGGYHQDDPWRDYFHEGDSPNQFLIREENGSAKLYFYNGVGQEFQIWPEVPPK